MTKPQPAPTPDEPPTSSRLLPALWKETAEEPTKLAGLASLWFFAVGLFHLAGSGFAFDLNVIDLASPSDFLVSGLRNPLVVFLTLVTGLGLYPMLRRAKDTRSEVALLGAVVTVLGLCSLCSWAYRHAVVYGSWNSSFLAPKPLTIVAETSYDGYRLGVATGDFLIFGKPGARALVLPKSTIKSMEVGEHRGPCDSGQSPGK